MKRRRITKGNAPALSLSLPMDNHGEVQVQNRKTDDLTAFIIDGNEELASPLFAVSTDIGQSSKVRGCDSFTKEREPLKHSCTGEALSNSTPSSWGTEPTVKNSIGGLSKSANPAGTVSKQNARFFHVDETNLFVLVDGLSMFYEGKSTYTGVIDPALLKKLGEKEQLRARRQRCKHDPSTCTTTECAGMCRCLQTNDDDPVGAEEESDTVALAIRDLECASPSYGSPLLREMTNVVVTSSPNIANGNEDLKNNLFLSPGRAPGRNCSDWSSSPTKPIASPRSSYAELFTGCPKFQLAPLFRRSFATSNVASLTSTTASTESSNFSPDKAFSMSGKKCGVANNDASTPLSTTIDFSSPSGSPTIMTKQHEPTEAVPKNFNPNQAALGVGDITSAVSSFSSPTGSKRRKKKEKRRERCFSGLLEASGSSRNRGDAVVSLGSLGVQNDSVELENVRFCHVIGSGSQGTVSMVELNKKYYAMKRIDVKGVTSTLNAMERHVRKRGLIRELEMIREQNLSNEPQHLIRMFNAVIKKQDEREDLYLLMELMSSDVEKLVKMMSRLYATDGARIAQGTFKEYMAGRSTEELNRLQQDLRGTCKHMTGRMKFSEPENWEVKVEGRQTPFPEIVLALLAIDVLQGLKELHEDYHVVHCDLKPGNILLSYDKEHFKIADFGCSRPLVPHSQRVACDDEDVGTKLYKSPERFPAISTGVNLAANPDKEEPTFGPKADVWSLGIILLELSGGIHPCNQFKSEYWNYASYLKLSKMVKPLKWTPALFDFILRCTFVDEEERWSVNQLLKHPFVARVRNIPRKRLANFVTRLEEESVTIGARRYKEWLEEQIRLSSLHTKINYQKQSYKCWVEFTSFLPRDGPALADRSVYPEL